MLFLGSMIALFVGGILGCLCAPYVESLLGLVPVYAVNMRVGLGIVGYVGLALAIAFFVLLFVVVMAMPSLGYKLPDRPLTFKWVVIGAVCGFVMGVMEKMTRNQTIPQELVCISFFVAAIFCLLSTGVVFELPAMFRKSRQ